MGAVAVEPVANYLRPNGHGGYIVRQSDLSSWDRCQLQKFYEDRGRVDPTAPQRKGLSATVYGTVLHFALHVLERARHDDDPDAVAKAVATFEYYWRPDHLLELEGTQMIEEWIGSGRYRDTYGGLLDRGRTALRMYAAKTEVADERLLALEYQYAIPLYVNGRQHTLTGTLDKLTLRKYYGRPYLSIDDYKSGRQPRYLRWNMQGSVYSWATTQPGFWLGDPDHAAALGVQLDPFGPEVMQSLLDYFGSWGYDLLEGGSKRLAARRFRWINMREVSMGDGGWRAPRDYSRMGQAIDAYVRSCEQAIYSVNTVGEVCMFCDFKDICAVVGLPDETEGAP